MSWQRSVQPRLVVMAGGLDIGQAALDLRVETLHLLHDTQPLDARDHHLLAKNCASFWNLTATSSCAATACAVWSISVA